MNEVGLAKKIELLCNSTIKTINRMKNLITSLTLLITIVISVNAQENPSSKKNELSLDVLTFTRNTNVPGIIYKRKFDKGAFRIKFNSSFDLSEVSNSESFPDPEASLVTTTNEVSESSNQFFIGYEVNKHIQSKWTVLYGADFVIDLSKDVNTTKVVTKRDNGTTSRISTTEMETSSSKFGLAPFVGCNYYFNESVTIGIESYVVALFGSEEVTTIITEQTSTINSRIVDSSSPSTIEFDLSPKTLIVIGYRF